MNSLQLHFSNDLNLQLVKVIFFRNSHATFSIRGKDSGAYKNAGTFIWSKSVKALSVFFLKSVVKYQKDQFCIISKFLPVMEGRKGSQASSLMHSINFEPRWLLSMFGKDQKGKSYLRRFIKLTNNNFQHNNVVHLGLDDLVLCPSKIEVFINNLRVCKIEELEDMLYQIEEKSLYKESQLSLF